MTAAPLDLVDDAGFAVITLFDAPVVAALRDLVAAEDLEREHAFYASVAHAYGPRARSFDQAAKAIAGPSIRAALPGQDLFLASITSKGERTSATLPYHQDWTYCDDRRHRTVFAWCPLVATDVANGTLRVVPGSHRWSGGIRPSRAVEVTEHLQERFDALAVPVPLAPGEALLFHPAVIHGSGPNRSSRQRPAITFATVSAGAPLVHFHERPDGQMTGSVVDDAFFTEHPYGQEPTGYPPVEPWGGATAAADFEASLAHAEAEGLPQAVRA